MGTWRGWFVLLALMCFLSSDVLAQSDTEPPVLVDFDFDPRNVDVTTGDAIVTCSITLADLPAGVQYAQCQFFSPSQGQYRSCSAGTPSSGDVNNGTWSCTNTIPRYAEEGAWTARLETRDLAGNFTFFTATQLENLGFPAELQVVSEEDSLPPILVDFDFDPRNVDVTTGDAIVTCSITLADLPAGVQYAQCQFFSPSQGQYRSCSAGTPSSGDVNNGTWSCTNTIPRYAEEGAWTARLETRDLAGNFTFFTATQLENLGFPAELQVVSEEDSLPPILVDFDFDPRNVDVTTGDAIVTCSITLADLPAGVQYAQCQFFSPSQGQYRSCSAGTPSSGDVNNGTWSCTNTIPRYAEEGAWTARLETRDLAGNFTFFTATQLENLGFPAELQVGFVFGAPHAELSAPSEGKTVRGNSVTARARLTQGSPVDVSPTLGIALDFRVLPFGEFAPIPARNPNHPNPDTTYPYFTHWDVSQVPDGDYELRAVAHDLAGTPDPAPETITITIDHGGPADVDEYVNADGRQENRTAVDSASESKIASGDLTDASTATELTLPYGSLTFTTDTAKLVYPDPADEVGQLEQDEQSIDAFVDLSLLSGQTDLEGGMTGDLNVSYSDANQDGVVDGTSIREEDLELRYLDTGTNSYVVLPSIVLTEHNMVHAEPGFLGKFALAGPLMPRMWIETDKETLTWDAVSTATSYVVYRGLLSALVDVDLDGLPDSGFGDCVSHLDGDPADLLFVDPDDPGADDGYFYLVGFVGPSGAAGLGNTSAGLRREPTVTCP